MTYLGVDIGTSGVKAILIDRAGRALGEATARSVEPVRPHPGWSEQNPADWWTAVLAALDALSKSHPAEMAAVSAATGGNSRPDSNRLFLPAARCAHGSDRRSSPPS